MSPLMRSVIEAQRAKRHEHGPGAALVFPSERGSETGEMSGWTKLVAKLRTASGVDFTLHDLRRTTRTLMSRLGVDEDIAERCIGHKRGVLIEIYDKDRAEAARRAAFEALSRRVEDLVSPEPETAENVVRIAAARAG